MDKGIGRILAALAATGAADDALVVFADDDGGRRLLRHLAAGGQEGMEPDLLEGGIRVPYIVRWPGRVPRGRTTSQTVITMDWVATFLDAAGDGGAPRLRARRHQPLAGAGRPGHSRRSGPLLANEVP